MPGQTRRWWTEHVTLIVTSTVFVLFVLRLLVVAHGDITTATAIVRHSAPPTVLFGMAVAGGLLFLVFAGVGMCLTALMYTHPERPTLLRWYAALAMLCLLLAVVFSVGAGVLFMFVGAGVYVFKERPRERQNEPTTLSALLRVTVPASLVLAVFLLAFGDDSMWLPSERLELDDGRTFTAYVLDDNDSDTVVLREKSRVIERLDADAIEERSFCSLRSTAVPKPFRPAHALFDDETRRYPKCP